ncbi:MAG: deoxyribose-phosphate aldolase [Calditrichaeota bacterium]|nr:MAG: deoxyribose-phosphate aldolase [Calditrichota bacterium]
MNKTELVRFFDHTNLNQDATDSDINKLCMEAIEHNFYSVCVNPSYVTFASELLQNQKPIVCSVVGFPLGSNKSDIKLQEALLAVTDGADEIDMVVNIADIKNGNYEKITDEVSTIRKNLPFNIILKVIVESQNLSDTEIKKIAGILIDCDVQYIKTSTGFFGGATIENVELIKSIVGEKIKIKASGGIKTYSDCIKLIKAGADRIGSSASINIIDSID